ncbi:MAG: hypothetical protein KDE46_00925, partial [Caldilineaceae bacterium]|nr:hypothetical protein [Caldilineaceae bacterium]
MMVAVILMWCLFEGLAASSQFRVNSGDLQTIANSPRAGQIQDSPVITITDAGFVPSNITVSVGVTITWYNATNSTQDLIAQPTYRLFLPLIQNSADINGVQGASQEQANEQPGEERGIGGLQASQLAKIGVRGPFSGTIPPGQTLQQQFNTPGEFTQLLKNNPGIIGRIVIEQVRPTPGATPTPVDSATPTVTQEPAPTATATLTDTPIPSNTTETESTATPTVESTHTSTPTETPGVDDTATPTAIPTSTDTATPTSISTESPTPTATAIPSDTPTSTATDTATPTFTPTNTATNIPTPTATSTGPTNVCGTISADTTWGLGATPFIVTCPIRVANGATLTIEHGVEVRFRPNTGLRIEGVISATGTVDLPILLTSDASSPTPGNWTGIYFAPTSTGSVLEHVQMQYAGARYDLTHPDPAITTNTNFLFTLSSVYVDESD